MVVVQDDDEQARAALEPFLRQLRVALEHRERQPGREPFQIAVPLSFPKGCDNMTLWTLAVRRMDVDQPRVDFRRRQPAAQWPQRVPVHEKPQAAGDIVKGRFASLRSVNVFMTLAGPSYHMRTDCSVLASELQTADPRMGEVASHLAHRSRLEPCTACSAIGLGDCCTDR